MVFIENLMVFNLFQNFLMKKHNFMVNLLARKTFIGFMVKSIVN